MARIAVTGVSSFLGSRVLRKLVELRGPEAVVAIDIAAPPATLGVRHRELDFTQPGSDRLLLEVLREEQVQSVVHLAFFTNPQRDRGYAHELESIGTLNLLAAAAAAGVGHVVLRSTTAVYGARGQNPNFLTEEHPLHPDTALAWVRDKLEAEQHALSFGRRYRSMPITVLRIAPLLGPGVRTFYTAILDKRVVPHLMGYDPLVQLLHPDDALQAMLLALEQPVRGAFNVVPRGSIPLVTALHLASKIPLPVPHPMAYAVADLLWMAALGGAPGAFLDYVRFPFLADGEKSARELGFRASHSSRESLLAYLQYRHPAKVSEPAQAPA